jgi:hypothetical protein
VRREEDATDFDVTETEGNNLTSAMISPRSNPWRRNMAGAGVVGGAGKAASPRLPSPAVVREARKEWEVASRMWRHDAVVGTANTQANARLGSLGSQQQQQQQQMTSPRELGEVQKQQVRMMNAKLVFMRCRQRQQAGANGWSVFTHTHTHTHTSGRARTHTNERARTYIHAYIHTYIYTYAHIRTHNCR